MISEYNNNREMIDSHLQGKPFEGMGENLIMGLTVGVFLIILLIFLGLWIWAVVLLVQNGNKMPTWALVVGIIALFIPIPLSSVITIVLAKTARKKGMRYHSH